MSSIRSLHRHLDHLRLLLHHRLEQARHHAARFVEHARRIGRSAWHHPKDAFHRARTPAACLMAPPLEHVRPAKGGAPPGDGRFRRIPDVLETIGDPARVAVGAANFKKGIGVAKDGLNLLSAGRGVEEVSSRADAATATVRGQLDGRFGEGTVGNAFKVQGAGVARLRVFGGAAGILASGAALASGDYHSAPRTLLDGGNIATGGAQIVAGTKEAGAIKSGATLDEAAQAAGKFGGLARFGGLATGLAAGGLQIFQGVKKHKNAMIAQGGVGVAGSVAAFAVAGAVGGPLGIAAGAGVGLLSFGISWGIGKLFG